MCVYDVSRVRRRHERFILENGGVIVLEHRKRSVSVIINCATWLPFSRSFLKSFHVSIVQNFEKERMEDRYIKGGRIFVFQFPFGWPRVKRKEGRKKGSGEKRHATAKLRARSFPFAWRRSQCSQRASNCQPLGSRAPP